MAEEYQPEKQSPENESKHNSDLLAFIYNGKTIFPAPVERDFLIDNFLDFRDVIDEIYLLSQNNQTDELQKKTKTLRDTIRRRLRNRN